MDHNTSDPLIGYQKITAVSYNKKGNLPGTSQLTYLKYLICRGYIHKNIRGTSDAKCGMSAHRLILKKSSMGYNLSQLFLKFLFHHTSPAINLPL